MKLHYFFLFSICACAFLHVNTIQTEESWEELVAQFDQDLKDHIEASDPPQELESTQASSLTYDQWQEIAPFLLPDNHPAKRQLDKIFTQARVTSNIATFRLAGFKTKGPGSSSKTVVAKHPKVKGVILKLFFDDQPNINEVTKLMNRVRGSEIARNIVDSHNWNHLFKVPHKWIYILPDKPGSAEKYPKNIILVAEDMKILSRRYNYSKWRNKMTTPLLEAIFAVLTEGGFYDAAYAFNMPYATDGRIALIDLEQYHGWPVPYHKLNKYLSSTMEAYWNLMIQNQLLLQAH